MKKQLIRRSNPFLDILPKIDVHGYTRDSVIYVVDEFINDSLKMGHYKIVVIHGIGEGILKREIKMRFQRDKRVSKLYISLDNIGCTIIELNH